MEGKEVRFGIFNSALFDDHHGCPVAGQRDATFTPMVALFVAGIEGLVAMTETPTTPVLAQADVGVAMNTGT